LYHATMRMLKTKYGEEYPAYPRNYRHQELKKAEEQLQRLRFRTTSYQWDERGPSNVPGRTRGLVVDPRDPTQNTWLAGAVGGGVWKTTNGGLSWTHLTSNMPNLAIGSLAIAPSNPDVIYAGTGEAGIDGVGATGDGLYKSTDGGNTWVHLSSTSQFIDFENVSRIVVHPQNENILLVAVTADTQNYRTIGWQSAIYRSEDGGNSWIKTYESLGFSVEQLVAHPSDFNILYATVNRIGVLKSTDSGRTWRLCKKGMGQVSRVEIAISPTNPNVLYASCEGTLSGNNSDIYVSEDGGESWMLMIEEKKPDGSAGTNPDWLANQGWYNNTIMVHPFNDRAVYVGGVSLWFLERLQGQGTSINAVTGLSLIGTESFLFNEIRLFTDNGTNLQEGDFTAVEIRFGNGRKQKAHRFTVPAGSTSGVPANQYTYRDYVDVPFEVWDITNNRQLMVSFRDQAADGKFNLLPDFNASREYIFVHALPYNAQQPSSSVAQQGGHTFRSPYLLWMRTNDGVIFNENQLPNSLIRINYEKINTVFKRSTCVADPYGEFNKRNRQVHPDHHNLVAQIRGNEYRILNANDGGVYATDYSTGNAGTAEGSWRMAGNTYNTTQFYGVDKRPNLNMYIGGTQDNGTWVSGNVSNPDATTAYRFVWGGDGFEVVWSGNPNKVMFSSQFNGIGRNLNGFQST
ncbi:MAG: glycoside hydrolase, partial [Flammeovirgaceae bacterium]|nr:glycoside hydrolase [Flammeovirgaceae bacterium]